VLLFSDFEAARRFDPSRKADIESLRGSYHLDRITGKEELNIFLDPKEPQRNIKIDLTARSKAFELEGYGGEIASAVSLSFDEAIRASQARVSGDTSLRGI